MSLLNHLPVQAELPVVEADEVEVDLIQPVPLALPWHDVCIERQKSAPVPRQPRYLAAASHERDRRAALQDGLVHLCAIAALDLQPTAWQCKTVK